MRGENADAEAEVRETIGAYERVWNSRDAAALGEFFAPDADMLFGNGPLVRGREAIRDWWALYFSRLDDGREGRFTVDSVRSIAPGVFVLNVNSWTGGKSSGAEELPARLARGTWAQMIRRVYEANP